MSFEDRIRQAVGRALDDVRARMEQEVRALVQELAATAAQDRQVAVAQGREQALAEARQDADQRVADAEARLTATIDRVVADACAREREQATVQARRVFEVDAGLRSCQLLEAIRTLDDARSPDDVLDALSDAIGREAGRNAVLIVRGTSFHGWSLSGFGGLDAQPERLDVPVARAPLVQLAIETCRAVISGDEEPTPVGPEAPVTPFTGRGLAVPLVVADRVVAVVYADALAADGRDAPVTAEWSSSVELLARHAARCLATVESDEAAAMFPMAATSRTPTEREPPRPQRVGRQTQAEAFPDHASEDSARRLARLLITEIKLHNESSVDEGRRAGNLLARLRPQIDRARLVYDARVPLTLTSRAQLFQQELVATLADGDASRLGVPA